MSKTCTSFNICYKDIALKKLTSIFKEAKTILDIGCSNGQILNNIQSDALKIGVDIDISSMIKNSPNILDGNIDLILVCNARKLPIKDSSIDVVLCCDILEHLIDPERILEEAYRTLRPNGKLIITVPNLVSLGNRVSILFGSGKGIELAQLLKFKSPFVPISGPRFPDQRYHIRWFTSKSISNFLGMNGFRVLSKFGVGPIITRLKIGFFTDNLGLLIGILAEKEYSRK